jgi:pyoverdine/dityrosine biosynthesis protein Dit1
VIGLVAVLCIGDSDRFVATHSSDFGKMLQLLAGCSTDRVVDIGIVALASERLKVLH